MKTWNQPALEELNLNATAYAGNPGVVVDGSYTSSDGNYEIPTFGPSGAEPV